MAVNTRQLSLRRSIKLTSFFLFFFFLSPLINYADTVSSLVGWWKFDEGAGTSLGDNTRQGNAGSAAGHAPTWTNNCHRKSCLSFNGSNQYVSMGTPAVLDITSNQISVSAWVNISVLHDGGIITKDTGAAATQYVLMATNFFGSQVITWKVSTNVSNYSLTSGVIPIGVWNHVAATYDGSTMRIFINGVSSASAAASGNVTTRAVAVAVGAGNAGATNNFKGNIDDVRVYQRALSAQDILMLYLDDNKVRNVVMRNVRFK